MNPIRKLQPAVAIAALVLASTTAQAGHENIVLEAMLDGRQEVKTGATNNAIVGDPRGRGHAYVFGIDNAPATLCYVIVDLRIAELELAPGGPRMAHIHEGERGRNGPVVANLAWPQGGQASDCLTEGQAGKFPTGEAGIVQRILNQPEQFYINIHNAAYPAGAVRGQLSHVGH